MRGAFKPIYKERYDAVINMAANITRECS